MSIWISKADRRINIHQPYNFNDKCENVGVFVRPFRSEYIFSSHATVVKAVFDGHDVINMSRWLLLYFLSRDIITFSVTVAKNVKTLVLESQRQKMYFITVLCLFPFL